jgi:hypothetical protein
MVSFRWPCDGTYFPWASLPSELTAENRPLAAKESVSQVAPVSSVQTVPGFTLFGVLEAAGSLAVLGALEAKAETPVAATPVDVTSKRVVNFAQLRM